MTNKIQIITEEEADEAEFVVCVRLTQPMMFPDNIITLCCRCGEAIQHRPHVPKGVPTVCMECIDPDFKKDVAKGEMTLMLTPETAHEVLGYLRKRYLRKKRAN